MNTDVMIVALIAGVANWAFRVLPTRLSLSELAADSLLARFLAATGPAAIATLCVASILPALPLVPKDMAAMVFGISVVLAMFFRTRSVVGATLAGSAAYGIAVWALN